MLTSAIDQNKINFAVVLLSGLYISLVLSPYAAIPLIAVLDQMNQSG